MLDIRFIRENPELVEKSAKAKGYQVDVKKLLEADDKRRKLTAESEQIRAERNQIATLIAGEQPSPAKIEKGKELKEKLEQFQAQINPINEECEQLLKEIPNIIPDDTPQGGEEDRESSGERTGVTASALLEPDLHESGHRILPGLWIVR